MDENFSHFRSNQRRCHNAPHPKLSCSCQCPLGDDPGTYNDQREVQLLQCYSSGGHFTLSFRQQTTKELPWDIEEFELKKELESLSTISSVDVEYTRQQVTSSTNSSYLPISTCTSPPCEMTNVGTTAAHSSVTDLEGCKEACDGISGCSSFGFSSKSGDCSTYSVTWHNSTSLSKPSSDGIQSYYHTDDPLLIRGVNKIGICTNSSQNNVAIISFNSPSGDVPAIKAAASSDMALKDNVYDLSYGLLSVASDGSTLAGEASVKGTTDELVCSGRGSCSSEFGYCNCHTGWGSSDGKGGMGTLNDCGFRQDPIVSGT